MNRFALNAMQRVVSPSLNRLRTNIAVIACIVSAAILATGCKQEPRDAGMEAYTPGLGEIMTLQQIRHAKLWFAGENGNWELASYELDELEEGFQDAVKYHPSHKDVPESLTTLVPRFVNAPLAELRSALNAKDAAGFAAGYDALTVSCNNCHQAAQFSFNVVKRPTSPPFSNQEFLIPH